MMARTKKPALFVVDKPAEPELSFEQRIGEMKMLDGLLDEMRQYGMKRRRELFLWLADHPDVIDPPGAPRLTSAKNKPSA